MISIRLKVWWFFTGDWWWNRLEGKVPELWLERVATATEWLQKPICAVMGHIPERDQCNLPEHDYCICCQRLMPGAARR
jgi:hypothetical protein